MQRLVLASALLLATSSSASAQLMWGNWSNAPTPNTIVTLNPAVPGTFTTIGATGIPNTSFVNSLDFAGNGNLYLGTNQPTGFLHQINTTTGAATLIGGSGLSGTDTMGDLSWDAFNNRMLAIGTPGVAAGGGRLYQVDLATGNLTNLGTIGGGFTEGFSVSLAVRPSDGAIFAHGIETDRWYNIDPGTLVATPLGLLGVSTNFGQGGTFDPNTGTLYHAMLTTDGGNMNRLATIDTTTGLPTFLGTMGGPGLTQVGDIAFQPIPEPTSLALLGLSAAGFGWYRRRKSK